ncbi:hypothetical protein LJC02_00410, partial [Breznakia sp. OttesenSCG-928-G09]|nr:hypothetical protein [Breznakia sp. OttesenSCG-928-G09]
MEIGSDVILAVKTEIENMPVKYKFIALLWYFEEFTVVDISNILNIPEEIVEIRIDKVESMIRPTILVEGMTSARKYSKHFPVVVSKAFDLIIKSYQMP